MFQGRGEIVGMSATGVTVNAVDREELDDQLGQGSNLTVTAQIADPKVMQKLQTGQEVTISVELGPTAEERDEHRQKSERRSSGSVTKTARQGETERSSASTGGGLRRDQDQPTGGRHGEAPGTGAKADK